MAAVISDKLQRISAGFQITLFP